MLSGELRGLEASRRACCMLPRSWRRRFRVLIVRFALCVRRHGDRVKAMWCNMGCAVFAKGADGWRGLRHRQLVRTPEHHERCNVRTAHANYLMLRPSPTSYTHARRQASRSHSVFSLDPSTDRSSCDGPWRMLALVILLCASCGGWNLCALLSRNLVCSYSSIRMQQMSACVCFVLCRGPRGPSGCDMCVGRCMKS